MQRRFRQVLLECCCRITSLSLIRAISMSADPSSVVIVGSGLGALAISCSTVHVITVAVRSFVPLPTRRGRVASGADVRARECVCAFVCV